MMDLLLNGFLTFFSVKYIVGCFLGVFIGTIVGVLPGLGPASTLALMLPFTLRQDPIFGLIMLSGVLCGAMYGGSTTSILVNIPGESASVITCIDGYQMAQKGRGGAALTVAAVGSFIAGTIAIIGMQLFSPPLARAALAFGPPEYFALMVFSFTVISTLSTGSPVKGSLMFALGAFIGIVGICPLTSVVRFTFGSQYLMLGIDFLPVAVGVFGISEVFSIAMRPYAPPGLKKVRFKELYPTKKEIRRSVYPISRGSIIGFFSGLIPGLGPVMATFLSYSLEKRMSHTPEEFGKGAIEGVAGPESANNSAMVSSLIPLLTLGIPFGPSAAILLAALLMHNVEPGPLLFQNSPEIFWTFIASLYIGNIVLLILNLPLVGFFARIAMIRPPLLMPFICIICLFGIYSVRNNLIDVWIMVLSGAAGFYFRKWSYPIAPLVIGVILGPITENSFRKSLMMFEGDLTAFAHRPIALSFLGLSFMVIAFEIIRSLLPKDKKSRYALSSDETD